MSRNLEHLLTIIIRTVEGSTKGQDNLSLTAEEASLFFKVRVRREVRVRDLPLALSICSRSS